MPASLNDARLCKALSPLLYACGYFQRHWRRRGKSAAATVVLCYHRVVQRGEGAGLFTVERGLTCDVFEAQLRFMLRHFRPVLPRHALSVDEGTGIRFAVTFDDGYEDNMTVAAPILRRVGIPAAFYVVTDYVGTNRRFWWERLGAMLRASRAKRLPLTVLFQGAAQRDCGAPESLDLRSQAQKEAAHRLVSQLLAQRPHECVAPLLSRLAGLLEADAQDWGRDYPLMDWDALRALSRQGFEIGCHSASHRNMRFDAGPQLEREVENAAAHIEAEIGERPRTFVYPYGVWSAEAAAAVEQAGFTAAFACDSGIVDRHANPFALPRIELNRSWPFALGYNVHMGFLASGPQRTQ